MTTRHHILTLNEAKALPIWRRPITLLLLMAVAMPIAFSTWSALLNNWVIEVVDFTGTPFDAAEIIDPVGAAIPTDVIWDSFMKTYNS